MAEELLKDRIEQTILGVAKERGVIMGIIAANHMAIDVLMAIREPNQAMINAGFEARDNERSPIAIWKAMIDAALEAN